MSSTTISPMTTLQGHTACQVWTMPVPMPDGSIQHRVYLVPYLGPIPAGCAVLKSLKELEQLQPQAGPTLIPSSQPQKSSLQIVTPRVHNEMTQRTVKSSGTMNKVDANGATNENKVSGESSANSNPSPSAASVEECSKKIDVSMVDHDTEEKSHVISNVQQPVENKTVVAPQISEVPPATHRKAQPSNIKSDPALAARVPGEEFPSLGGASVTRIRDNSASTGEIIREESMNTSSESGESSQSDFSKEYAKAYVYKTTKRVRVRANKTPTSEAIGILDANQYVRVVAVEGKKARIIEPLNGWVSMKKKKEVQVLQVFNNWQAPTVILRNLDPSLKKEKDVLNFLRKQDLRPTRCNWLKKDDFVTVFFTKHKDASKLVRGKYSCNDTKLVAEWADSYAKMVQL